MNKAAFHQRPQSNAYYWAFRKDDTMSTSYTKDIVDFTSKNLYQPKFNQLYIGWTANGDWTNYTVNVKIPGKYKIVAVYSNKPNTIKFSINNKPAAECKLPVDTGYYHQWNRAPIGEITFPEKGLQLLTFYFDAPEVTDKLPGNNFAYFEFFLEKEIKDAPAADSPAPAASPVPATQAAPAPASVDKSVHVGTTVSGTRHADGTLWRRPTNSDDGKRQVRAPTNVGGSIFYRLPSNSHRYEKDVADCDDCVCGFLRGNDFARG